MEDQVTAKIQEALDSARNQAGSRENSLVITHLETALLWRRFGTSVTQSETADKARRAS